MAFLTPVGFDGPLFDKGWSRVIARSGQRYAVDGPTSWELGGTGADRVVTVAAGVGAAAGVIGETTGTETLTAAAVGDGFLGRFDLAVARRDWKAKTVRFVLLPAASTITAIDFEAPGNWWPKSFPSTFRSEPGVVDDQPLGWVYVRKSGGINTLDLRDLTPDYLTTPGNPRVRLMAAAEQRVEPVTTVKLGTGVFGSSRTPPSALGVLDLRKDATIQVLRTGLYRVSFRITVGPIGASRGSFKAFVLRNTDNDFRDPEPRTIVCEDEVEASPKYRRWLSAEAEVVLQAGDVLRMSGASNETDGPSAWGNYSADSVDGGGATHFLVELIDTDTRLLG